MKLSGKRLTFNKLVQWVNLKFKELEIDNYEAYEARRTYYTSEQYEAGAAKIIVAFREKCDTKNTGYFLISYSIKELVEYLRLGYKLTLCPENHSRLKSISNLTIEPIK